MPHRFLAGYDAPGEAITEELEARGLRDLETFCLMGVRTMF
jgi:hypothetical protein